MTLTGMLLDVIDDFLKLTLWATDYCVMICFLFVRENHWPQFAFSLLAVLVSVLINDQTSGICCIFKIVLILFNTFHTLFSWIQAVVVAVASTPSLISPSKAPFKWSLALLVWPFLFLLDFTFNSEEGHPSFSSDTTNIWHHGNNQISGRYALCPASCLNGSITNFLFVKGEVYIQLIVMFCC